MVELIHSDVAVYITITDYDYFLLSRQLLVTPLYLKVCAATKGLACYL